MIFTLSNLNVPIFGGVVLANRCDGLEQCKKCGTYMPSYWRYCTRCGQPLRGRHHSGWKWILLAVPVLVAFISGGYVERLFRDSSPSQVESRLDSISPKAEDDGITDKGTALPENEITPPETKTDIPESTPDFKGNTAAAGNAAEVTVQSPKAPETPAPEPDMPSGSSGETASGALTYEQKLEKINQLVTAALKNADEQVTLPVLGTGNDSKIVFQIIEKAVLENPEIMFYEGARYRSDGLLTLKYSRHRDYVLKAAEATVKRADEILGTVLKPGMNDFEKELAIHDYIVNNCSYDIENLKKGATPPESYTAYGALVKGRAVCEGYAKAMKLLLDKADIPCLIVAGTSRGNNHAWNIVCLDGQYYHVDATWDDPVMADGSHILSHVYFNLADEEIQKDHSWDKTLYPACSGTDYNYYRYYGLMVNSQEELDAFLGQAVKSGMDHVSVRIADFDTGNYDISSSVQKTALASGMWNIYYSVNDTYGIVDIWLR